MLILISLSRFDQWRILYPTDSTLTKLCLDGDYQIFPKVRRVKSEMRLLEPLVILHGSPW